MYNGVRDCTSVAEAAFYPPLFTPVPMTGWELWPIGFQTYLEKESNLSLTNGCRPPSWCWGKPRVRNQLLFPYFSSSFSSSNMSGRRGLAWEASCILHCVHGDNFAGQVSSLPVAKHPRNVVCPCLLSFSLQSQHHRLGDHAGQRQT